MNWTNLRQLEIDYGIANHQIRTTQEEIVTLKVQQMMFFISVFMGMSIVVKRISNVN